MIDRSSFAPLVFPSRRQRVLDAVEAREQSALIVSKPVNVRWLTGFTGSNGNVLVAGDRLALVTDGRYREQAEAEVSAAGIEVDILIDRDPWAALAHWGGEIGGLAFESHHLTVDQEAALARSWPEVELTAVGNMIDGLRTVKDPGEQDRLRAAAAIADRALRIVGPQVIEGGPTERDIARALEGAMYDNGADGLSFETIVASGPNSARPHARPGDRRIAPGDLVVIDFGAAVDGYGSDMTRTLACGGEPTERQQALYDAVAEAQSAGVAAVRAGAEEVEIDRACRHVLAERELAEAFVHGTGHGIGLEIHEEPFLSARSVGILHADLVVTVEPGAYLPGFGGVRVEDSVIVTDRGCEPITHSPKGLVPWPLSPPTI